MIYEIREYTTVPGRMPALVRRFNDHTKRIFAKHGMDCVFLSLTALGDNSNNELVYVMRFDSLADMDAKWSAFLTDPEWVAAKAASEEDGQIVAKLHRRVLNPAPFAD
ncbi:NIPSNAP family protein [Pseudonocardia benzenivorans]|jgi:hypothetical protein|uniref:NIPSNAP family containing protein n=2 Tax=Pseudonocardia TaxID=1847 RepID=F4CU15_PSEUX|nr:NIPSNAP family protein [Pseudonocardia dioxanivorans]AEA23423.1 NIPSNAP family containing protein [Pseudonocardia dioxanivorans CB1190]GJF04333.1 NIPSNAP family protein [Pseudonocardia sp. D17]